MSIDVIGDFLTIIRNGIMVSKLYVVAPYSKMKYGLALVLKNEGFIKDVTIVDDEKQNRMLKIFLKYVGSESVIHEIKRVSKPSRRVYGGAFKIKPVIGGLGVSILTTNQGVMSHKQAKNLRVGGEVLCTIW